MPVTGKPHSTFNGREARKLALQQHDGSGSVWDVLAFQLLGACEHIESLEEQLQHSVEDVASLTAKNLSLIEQLEAAREAVQACLTPSKPYADIPGAGQRGC